MEIGLIYSNKDPQQTDTRNFVRNFINERGILARVIESIQPVTSPTVIINGHTLRDLRQAPREINPRMFPSHDDIARAIEQHLWSL
jgi:hypothetical protein